MLVLLSWPTTSEILFIYIYIYIYIYIILLRNSPLLLHVSVQVSLFTGVDTRPVRLDYTPFRVPAKVTQQIFLSRPCVWPTDQQQQNVAKTTVRFSLTTRLDCMLSSSPQTGHTTLSYTPYRQLENQAPNTTGSNHLYNTLELLMMGTIVAKTCWASNKICNKNHLLHLVGILFPHSRKLRYRN